MNVFGSLMTYEYNFERYLRVKVVTGVLNPTKSYNIYSAFRVIEVLVSNHGDCITECGW